MEITIIEKGKQKKVEVMFLSILKAYMAGWFTWTAIIYLILKILEYFPNFPL